MADIAEVADKHRIGEQISVINEYAFAVHRRGDQLMLDGLKIQPGRPRIAVDDIVEYPIIG
ncbi:hypothetical protein IP88_00475 [alpha proteobacterium AAP81b]|nr:hypothetical protein IP88_00475 [alpha proteobacterium AAP81b]